MNIAGRNGLGRRVGWGATAVATMVALLTGVPAAPAAASPERRDPRDVPPLHSEPPAPDRNREAPVDHPNPNRAPTDGPVREPGKDYSRSFDEKSSKLTRRVAHGDLYRNADGTNTAVLHTQAVNWRDTEGKWHPIDPRLVDDGASALRNASSRVSVRLPKVTGASGPLATVAADGWSIGYTLEGARPGVSARVDGATARYEGLKDNLHVEEQALEEGLRELLILPTRPATADDAVFRFPLELTGVTPSSEADGSIAFRDAAGARVAAMPASVAWGDGESPARNEGIVRPLVLEGSPGQWTVEVRIPGWFLADPARRYPVTVDPTINAGIDTTQYDAFGSSADPTGNYNGERQRWNGRYVDFVGYDSFPDSQQYTYQFFDLGPVMGHGIASASWKAQAVAGRGDRFYRMYRVLGDWNASSVSWSNLPGHGEEHLDGNGPANGQWATQDLTQWVFNWITGVWPNKGISLDSAGRDSDLKLAASEDTVSSRPRIEVTYFDNPPGPGPALTPNGEKIIKPPLTLVGAAGTDAEGDALKYSFAISTSPDPGAGTVMESAEGTSLTWTPDLDRLADGVTYYWRMATSDGTSRSWSEYRKFTVDRRLGAPADVPLDTMGPVTANLATGNVFIPVSGPSFGTVGGPIGFGLAYNSRSPSRSGLIGTYTAHADPNIRMVRRDPSLSFDWGTSSPGGAIPADNFHVRWDGKIAMTQTAQWQFGALHDDSVTITVNGVTVLNRPGTGLHYSSTPIVLAAGVDVPITVEFDEFSDRAVLTVHARVAGTSGSFGLPGTLTTGTEVLPDGWTMTAGGVEHLSYSGLKVNATTLVLEEPEGGVHQYTRESDLSWKPTVYGDDVVTTSSEGGRTTYVVASSDGLTYTFDDGGRLIRAISTADDRNKPASAHYEYRGGPRLVEIVDPVGGGRLELIYAGPGVACPTHAPAGLTEQPPDGMLCEVKYPEATHPTPEDPAGRASVKLFYLAKRLVRVENPGSAVTDFAYDSSNRIVKVRDAAATDAINAGTRADDDTTRTLIAYDTSKRVSSITGPEPLAGAARPTHTYVYSFGTETLVRITGAPEPHGYSRRVVYDAAGLLKEDRDAAGLATRFVYDTAERLVSSLGPTADLNDPKALKRTNVYDHAGRLVEEYGPSPASCFGIVNFGTLWVPGTPDDGWELPGQPDGYSGERPNGSCTNPAVPVEKTRYDQRGDGQPIAGLAATYWDTVDMSGPPISHGTGVGEPTGALVRNWGVGQPDGVPTGENWSARFTGEIEFPERGTWWLRLCADDGVRLFLDDKKLIDDWRDTGTLCRDVEARNYGTIARKRLRIDYYERGGNADISLQWKLSGDYVPVPGAKLAPRYGLPTSTVDADGKETGTEYTRPEYGTPSATRVGPTSSGLRTRTEYEAPGVGFLRRIRRTMPKGDGSPTDPTATTYTYYDVGQVPLTNECGGLGAAGLLKATTSPDPAGAAGPVIRRLVYDAWHRSVGTRVDGDTRWSCTSYDSRGRVTGGVDSKGRVQTIGYSTPGEVNTTYADSEGTTRTTKEKIDLLGRAYSYTDEQGTETRKVFDQLGRVTETWRRFAGGQDVRIQDTAYDNVGRVASETEHLSGAPRTTTYAYDPATGRPTTTTRPNGVVTATGYDPNSGELTSLNHTKGASRLSNWSYGRSPAGNVTSEAHVSDVTAGRTRTYAYDAYKRLVTTTEAGQPIRNYAYDANGNRCANATSCASPTFTYDNADRLTASPYATGYTYDYRGNMVSSTPTNATAPSATVTDSAPFDSATSTNSHTTSVSVNTSGTLAASADSTATPPYTSASPTDTIAPAGTWTTTIPVRGISSLTTSLAWTSSTTGFAALTARYKTTGGTVVKSVTASTGSLRLDHVTTATPGTYTLEILNTSATRNVPSFSAPWSATVATQATLAPSLGGGATTSTALSAQADGRIGVSGTWNASTRTVSSTPTGTVGMGATAERTIAATAPGTISAALDWANPPVYTPTTSSGSLAAGQPWTAPVAVRGRTFVKGALSWTKSGTVWAPVTLRLKDAAGAVLATTSGASGALDLAYTTGDVAANYTLEIVNTSSSTAVPSWSMPWSTTTVAGTAPPTAIAAGAKSATSVTADAQGFLSAAASWAKGSRTVPSSATGSVGIGGTSSRDIVASPGPLSATLDWSPSPSYSSGRPNAPLPAGGTWSTSVPVRGKSYVVADMTYSLTPLTPARLTLKNAAGQVVATGERGPTAPGGMGLPLKVVTAPQAGTYTLEVQNLSSTDAISDMALPWSSTSVDTTTLASSPIAPGATANSGPMGSVGPGHVRGDISWAPGTRTRTESRQGGVAMGGSHSQTVEANATGTITGSVDWSPSPVYEKTSPTGSLPAGGTYSTPVPVRGQSSVTAELSWTASNGTRAPLTLRLKNAAGVVLYTNSGSSGSLNLGARGFATADEAATYTLEIVNTSATTAVPSWTMPWSSTSVTTVPLSGSITAATTRATTIPVDAMGHLRTTVDYTKGTHIVSGSVGMSNMPGNSSANPSIPADGKGAINVSLDWAPTQETYSETGTVPGSVDGSRYFDRQVVVSADGPIRADLSWPSGLAGPLTPDFAVVLLDPSGAEVARADTSTGSTPSEALSYNVTGVTYPATRAYTVRVLNKSPIDSAFTLSGDYWASAALDVELWSPGGTKVASSPAGATRPETLSYTATTESATPYTLKVLSTRATSATWTASYTYPEMKYATVTATLKKPDGATEVTRTSSNGRISFDEVTDTSGNYWLELTNGSTDLAVPSYTGSVQTPKTRTPNLDLELWRGTEKVASTSSTTAKPDSLTYTMPAGTTGTYTYKVITRDYDTPLYTLNVGYPRLAHALVKATLKDLSGVVLTKTSAEGVIDFDALTSTATNTYALDLTNMSTDVSVPSFTGTVLMPRERIANLDLELWSPAGTKVAETTSATARPETLNYTVPSTGAGTYTLKTVSRDHDAAWTLNESHTDAAYATLVGRIKSSTGTVLATTTSSTGSLKVDHLAASGAPYTVELENTSPDLAAPGITGSLEAPKQRITNLDLELWSPTGTKVAQAANTATAKPESLTYTVPSTATGNYVLKSISRNYDTNWSLSESHPETAFATVTGRLKNSSGTVVAAASSATGALTFDHLVPGAGAYTLELQNTSTNAASGASFTTTTPRLQYGPVGIELQTETGAVVATGTGNHPASLSTTVSPGNYKIVSKPTGGSGTLTMTATVPRQLESRIAYDASDHATEVDDGTTVVRETLSPEGRVIRRVVTDRVRSVVTEDTVFGYDNGGDSPSYSRPTGVGNVTTFLGDVVYTGTTGTWHLGNAHGDVAGTVDAVGVFTPVPMADEYGVGSPPSTRLGWLGMHKRFALGGESGFIRMGVRLYDPRLGRFLQVDPVEGGSANDYDYVRGDCVNLYDLDGRDASVAPYKNLFDHRCTKKAHSRAKSLSYGNYIRGGYEIVAKRRYKKGLGLLGGNALSDLAPWRMRKSPKKAIKALGRLASQATFVVQTAASAVDYSCTLYGEEYQRRYKYAPLNRE